jgi:putative effector of murein hydrolase
MSNERTNIEPLSLNGCNGMAGGSAGGSASGTAGDTAVIRCDRVCDCLAAFGMPLSGVLRALFRAFLKNLTFTPPPLPA